MCSRARPTFSSGFAKTLTCWAHSSRRCCATSRLSAGTTGTWSRYDVHGVELGAGSRLVLLWGAANRDPSHFDDANKFRLDRSGGKGHISFGKGAHFCVGAALPAWRPKSSSANSSIARHGSRRRIPADGCQACW